MLFSSLGAIPDAKAVRHASIAAGQNTLTASADIFDASDVGKIAVVTGAGPGGAKLFTKITGYTSPTVVALANAAATTIADLGVSIGTDCGPALQAALDALEESAGGTLIIDGVYLLRTGVNLNSLRAQDIRISGTGGDSGLIVAGNIDATMIRINNVGRLLFEGVNMAGTHDEPNDCLRVLHISNSFVRFEGCGFFGLASVTNYGAGLIYHELCDLVLRDNEFGGCVFSSGRDNSVVRGDLWLGFSDEGSRWIDYGTWGGIYYSKTGIAFSGAWVALGANRDPVANATSQSVARFTDSRFDEGCVAAVSVNVGNNPRINRVHLDGVQANNTLITGGTAFYLKGVDHVLIEQCAVGWTPLPRDAITLVNCGDVVVERMLTNTQAVGLSATGVDSILLRDSPTLTRFSLSAVGRFSREEDGVGGQVLFSKSGRVTDADYQVPPPIGTQALDRASRRIYTKLETVEGWVAGPVMNASTDPTLGLTNVTPTTGTLDAADTYRKTGATAWGNSTATLADGRTGSVRFRVKFFDVAASPIRAAIAGLLQQSTPLNATPTHNQFVIGIYQEGAQIYLKTGASIVAGPFAYASGQECELAVNAATGVNVLKIAGVQVFSGNLGANPTFAHRFSSALYSAGSKFQLLAYEGL